MGFDYDLEAAQKKLPEAIESVEDLINVKSPHAIEVLNDAAKTVNAANFTKIVKGMIEAIEATVAAFKSLLGVENDSAQTGTLYGALAGVKKMELAANG